MSAVELPLESLTPELDRPEDLGTEIDTGSFFAQIPDQPIGFSVGHVHERLGVALPEELAVYERDGAFKVYLVPHRVAIIRRGGVAEVTAVGIEVKYLNEDRTCSVAGLFPQFKYVVHGQVGADVQFGGAVDLNGQIAPLSKPTGEGPTVSLGGLQFSVGGGGRLHLSATVSTPIVSAIGEGSSGCEWRFDKDREPLFGRTIETWSAVVLPAGQEELLYSARFYFLTRVVLFSTRRTSAWSEPIRCPLMQ